MRHLHPGFWSFVARSLLYYLTLYVFLLYRPVSLVSPLKGNGCFTPGMTMTLQTLDKSHKNHVSECPLTRGPWLRYPLPQHCSAAAKQVRLSWLEQPSESTDHTHNRSLLPRLSIFFSTIAPKTFWFSQKEKGKSPLKEYFAIDGEINENLAAYLEEEQLPKLTTLV